MHMFDMIGVPLIATTILTMSMVQANRNPIFKSNKEFALKIYSFLSGHNRENIMFSPLSAHAVLSMVYQGANGNTKDALVSALDLPGKELTADIYHQVLQDIQNSTAEKIAIVNQIYVDKHIELSDDFSKVCSDKFLSHVETTDFTQKDAAANLVNEFVSEKTEHKIKDLFKAEDFSEKPDLLLVDTIYFKDKWAFYFRPSKETFDFHLTSENKRNVKMIGAKSVYNYKDDEALGAQVIESPFKDLPFKMVLVLPKERNALDKLEEALKSENPPNIFENLSLGYVDLKFPSFTIERTINMKDVLENMGLGELFDKQKCNLTGISQSQQALHVSKAIQKVAINVDENGCNTGVPKPDIRVIVLDPTDVTFIADHPFLFFIIEKIDGKVNILLAGRVTDPDQ